MRPVRRPKASSGRALPTLAPLVRDGKVQTEQIQAARPDVILDYGSTVARYADGATMVQEATGIPVLLLDGKLVYRIELDDEQFEALSQ